MKIGFDAKRAFNNSSGLGNYSRTTIEILVKYFPENEYFLYTPKLSEKIEFNVKGNSFLQMPGSLTGKTFHAWWRSFGIKNQIKKDAIRIFHGLSHELPFSIRNSGCRSVVTIHDLIFKRFPGLYKLPDRIIYHKKIANSCKIADKIIAISLQTKNDLTEYYSINEAKIEVVYQSCNPAYRQIYDPDEKLKIKSLYHLPESFILNVSTIEKRKNQKHILEAVICGNIDLPVVLIGRPKSYIDELNSFIKKNKLEKQVIFLHHVPNIHLPLIYQMAEIFVYPSVFEGFGLPVLEAISSGVPVITTKNGCFPEAGGPGSFYTSPYDPEETASQIRKISTDQNLKNKMIAAGLKYAGNFTEKSIAENLMNLYRQIS